MPDKDGYPTAQELKNLDNYKNHLFGYLEYIKLISNWGMFLRYTGKNVINIEMHTGGWSGNEEIIGHLKQSFFWLFCWQKSVRGGHYYFKVNIKTAGNFTKWGKIGPERRSHDKSHRSKNH